MREAVYAKVQQLSLAGITRHTAGDLITRITNDTKVMRDFVVDTTVDLIQMLLLFVSVVGVLFAMDWVLTLMILIPMPLVMLIFYACRRRMNLLYRKQWQSESAVNTLLHDVFSGIRVVKVFGTEKREEERFDKAARRVADISQKNETTWNLLMPLANFLMGIGEYAGAAVRRREGHRGRDDARRAQPVPHLRRDAVRSHPLGGVHPPPADPRDDLDGQNLRAARRGAGHPRPARSVRGARFAATSNSTTSASATTTMNMCSKTSACASKTAK